MVSWLAAALDARVPTTRPRRRAVFGVVVASLVACAVLLYVFGQWWPGCAGYDVGLQLSGTVARANDVIAGCPDVTAADTRIALLLDELFFPASYVTFGAGLALLLAGVPTSVTSFRARCVWVAVLLVLAGALDVLLENPSLFVVTLDHWPPRSSPISSTLLLLAAAAAWTKWGLIVVAGLSSLVLACVAVVKRPSS